MRSEVFLPTPGIAVSRARSPRSIARTSSCGSMPDSTASASFGPMPLMPISRSNSSCSSGGREPVQRQRVLADVRVDAQRDLAARVAEAVERRQRNGDVVADAVDVDHDAIRLLLENAGRAGARSRPCGPVAAPARGLARAARPSPRRTAARAMARAGGCECTWQMATASASAASCGDGTAGSRAAASPSAAPACFSARPYPTTARLISAGVYSTTGRPASTAASIATPRA